MIHGMSLPRQERDNNAMANKIHRGFTRLWLVVSIVLALVVVGLIANTGEYVEFPDRNEPNPVFLKWRLDIAVIHLLVAFVGISGVGHGVFFLGRWIVRGFRLILLGLSALVIIGCTTDDKGECKMPRITKIEDLMFLVELRSVYYVNTGIDGKEYKNIPNSRVVVNKESGKPLGVVSNNYKLITNEEALEMGKQCCADLFGSDAAGNIEVFNVNAPATRSYCHIDLVHRSYQMNLWDEPDQSDIYIPYLRVTNSYNTSRALRFDIGFCRKVCLNGVVFGAETIRLTFNHIKHRLTNDIRFVLQKGKIGKLVEDFKSYTNKLKNYHIPKAHALKIVHALFRIKAESKINFRSPKESGAEYDALLSILDCKLYKYIDELGENGYALFNAITDIASHTIDHNRYFRRDVNAMQRLAGNWIHSFQREIERSDFDIDSYLEKLKKSRNGSSALMRSQGSGSAVQGLLFGDFDNTVDLDT